MFLAGALGHVRSPTQENMARPGKTACEPAVKQPKILFERPEDRRAIPRRRLRVLLITCAQCFYGNDSVARQIACETCTKMRKQLPSFQVGEKVGGRRQTLPGVFIEL